MTRTKKVLSAVALLVVILISVLAVMLSHDAPCGVAPPLPANTTAMKAIVYRCYGSPDVVKLEDVPKPTLEDDRIDRKSTRLNSSHLRESRMPSSA